MIAPTYVGPSTTTVSPASRNDFATSSSASMPPLVTSSSSSAGRDPCSDSSRAASTSRVPGSPCVGAYWNADASPACGELGEQLCCALGRERQRVGKAAGERDQLGIREQPEDRRDPVPRARTRPLGEERLPDPRLARYRHGRTIVARSSAAKNPSECATAATAGAASSTSPPRRRAAQQRRAAARPRAASLPPARRHRASQPRRPPGCARRAAAVAAFAGAPPRARDPPARRSRSTPPARSCGAPPRADDEPRCHMWILITLQLFDDAAGRSLDREPFAVCEPVPQDRIRALEPGNRHGRPPRRVSAADGDRSNVSSRSSASGDAAGASRETAARAARRSAARSPEARAAGARSRGRRAASRR